MGIENFIAFMFTALLFIMTPGMDTIFVLNKAISQGKSSGNYAALGVNAGVIVHTLFAALGLSLIVTQSEYAFTAIKYIGAVYIVYMGIMQLRNKNDAMPKNPDLPDLSSRKNNFTAGFMTNALNPKVALFFLAFFPQFITPTQLHSPIPFLLLGLTYTLIGVLWYLILSYFAGTFSKKIQQNPNSTLWINRFSGGIFILMGVGIAFG